MSLPHREALVEQIVERQPKLGAFVRDLSTDLTAGSWDLVSYSFERGFEAFWDLARADHSGLLERPLLVLWRQSIELAIKSSTLEIGGQVEGQLGHDLQGLFDRLLEVRRAAGCRDEDDLAVSVASMIALVQAFDPFSDRFRYPASKGGKPYVGIAVDLDELFQAHWIITTWCEGAAMELKGDF